MLSINDITYTIGARTILEDCSANIMDIQLSARRRLGQVRQDIPECDTPLIDMVLAADEEMSALMEATETEADPNKLGDI